MTRSRQLSLLSGGFASSLLAWLVLAAPAGAQTGETADAGTADSAPAVSDVEMEVIPPAQIGRRIEETFRELQEVAPRLRRQREVLQIGAQLPRFRQDIDRLHRLPALERLDGLSPRALVDLEQEWSRAQRRLETWQTTLEARSDSLAEEHQHVVRARRFWKLTRNVEREDPLPESQVERIEALLEQIRRVARRLDVRSTEVLDLQSELSDEGLRISSSAARISAARQKARDERDQLDHEPLWTGGDALHGARPEPLPADTYHEQWATLKTLVRRDGTPLVLQALLFLLGTGLLFWLRRRFGGAAPRAHASPLRAARSRPVATAALLSLVMTPLVFTYVPSVVRGAALLLFVPAVLRLSPYLLPPPRRPVLALIGLSALSTVLAAGYAPAPVRRLLLVALPVAGIALAAMLQRELLARPKVKDRPLRLVQGALRVAGLSLVIALYSGVVGYVERAAVITDGAFTVILMTVVAYFAVELAGGLTRLVVRHRWVRTLRTFQRRRRQATSVLLRAYRWIGVLAVLYSALIGFDVLDPMLEDGRLLLRKSYEFGSIELSVGDVLSFLAVIAGTFVVVRFVHFLLSHELLPRFELGQGTEAAISLTVSYLLVALGVVLAFGKAGVNPERLALLGGALGVGIGFGLQNVVSNFVSGLILVAERPIKVGDIIEIGALVGAVQRIGIRSSTVRSLEGAEVIVPNSDLLSGNLVNWTLTDARRRIEIPIGTAYRHDPSEVKEILEKAIRGQPGVLNDPPGEVLVSGFGDSSIDYRIRVWTGSYVDGVRIQSALAQRVYKVLEEHGIEIPFPQRDLHVRSIGAEVAEAVGGAPGHDDEENAADADAADDDAADEDAAPDDA